MLIMQPTDKPTEDPQARGDPYRTLFIARLSYETTESDIEREFGRFGPIERVGCFPAKPHRNASADMVSV